MQVLARHLSILTVMMFFSFPAEGLAQNVGGRISVDEIISKAAEQRNTYIGEFKNLLSQEKKSIETFNGKGEVKKKRSITSTFIVYQLSSDEKNIAEYRNVLFVDGKKIDDADKRAEDFFERIVRLDSSNKELEKLADEGSRFDHEISLNGFTLYQAAPLAENIRPALSFRLERKDSLSGSAVYVISYAQTKQSPYILTDGQQAATDGKLTLRYDTGLDDRSAVIRLNGEFWIDAATFQVRREKRRLSVLPNGIGAPVTLAETVFDYEKSDFGILIPKRIEHTTFDVRKKDWSSSKNSKITFEYENFTRPDVEVKSSDVKQPSSH